MLFKKTTQGIVVADACKNINIPFIGELYIGLRY